jgi:hypothetical protein
MFVDDVMGRSRKHPSCAVHFSSPTDPLAYICADFPSLAQRDVKRPHLPPPPLSSGDVHKFGKVCSEHLFSLRRFMLHCIFIPDEPEGSFLLGCNVASQGNRFPTCRKNTRPSCLWVLEVQSDLSLRTSACSASYRRWFLIPDVVIQAVIQKLSLWL